MIPEKLKVTLLTILLVTSIVGQPVMAASDPSSFDKKFSPAALDVGTFMGAEINGNTVIQYESGNPGWYIWYTNGSYGSLVEWANESDQRSIRSHDPSTNRALVEASPGAIGVSWLDRVLNRGLAAEDFVTTIDINQRVENADPINALDTAESWSKPAHSWAALGKGEFTPNGVAWGDDVNKSTLGDARTAIGADGAAASGTGVNVGIIDTGLNVGDGNLFMDESGNFRLAGGRNFITNKSIQYGYAGILSRHTSGTDFDAGTYDNFSLVGTGSDAYLEQSPSVITQAYLDSAEGHWPFDAGSGTTAVDQINTNDGNISGATWTTDSVTGGQALEFNGTDYVDMGAASELSVSNFGDSFALVVWFKTKDNTTNQFITGRASVPQNTNYDISLIDHDSDGKVEVKGYIDGGGAGDPKSTVTPVENQWYMAVLQQNSTSGQKELYVDAVLDGTASAGTIASASTTPFRVGNKEEGTNPLNGTVDGLRFYRDHLTTKQIETLYSDPAAKLNTTNGGTGGLASYYSANYTVDAGDTSNTTSWVNVTANNVSADLVWEGYNSSTASWDVLTSKTVTSSGNYTFALDAQSYSTVRANVTTENTSSDFTTKLFDEGISTPGGFSVAASDFTAIEDSNGHGSWVASSIAANSANDSYDGVAPNASLYVAKALSEDGSGSTQDIIEAIQWASENDVDVLSLSLGSPIYSHALDAEIEQFLEDGGSAVVIAVGNSRQTTRWVASPADTPGAIAVAATNVERPQDGDNVSAMSAYFSNVGPDGGVTDMSQGQTRGATPDVAAPGMKLEAQLADGSTRTLSGTSMATPLVTGSIALYLDAHPEAAGDHEAIQKRVTETASPMPAAGQTEVGHGMVNVSNLLSGTIPEDTQEDVRTDEARARDTANRALTGRVGQILAKYTDSDFGSGATA